MFIPVFELESRLPRIIFYIKLDFLQQFLLRILSKHAKKSKKKKQLANCECNIISAFLKLLDRSRFRLFGLIVLMIAYREVVAHCRLDRKAVLNWSTIYVGFIQCVFKVDENPKTYNIQLRCSAQRTKKMWTRYGSPQCWCWAEYTGMLYIRVWL